MFFQKIKLINFKNYDNVSAKLSPHVNAVLGNNGMGKTNLLDAVHYLCLGKSYFSNQDKYVLKNESEFVRLEASVQTIESLDKIEIKLIPRKLKEIHVSNDKLGKLSELVGRFPCIVIAPIDVQLMLEGSEERRKFIDTTLIQYDKAYLQALITYNRLLKQRNALLKQMAENRTFNADLLDTYTKPMEAPAQLIFSKREAFCSLISSSFQSYYERISGGQEKCTLIYKSQLRGESFIKLVAEAQEKDRILGRSTVGIHKDDLTFLMEDQPLKYYGSQGQLKSFILALKLAQFDMLKRASSNTPVLLLDDIFDKLDEHRVEQLLNLVTGDGFGQVFISDTSQVLIPEILQKAGVDFATFIVDKGTLSH